MGNKKIKQQDRHKNRKQIWINAKLVEMMKTYADNNGDKLSSNYDKAIRQFLISKRVIIDGITFTSTK